MIRDSASSVESLVVGGQKVCTMTLINFKNKIMQTFWNTNNGGGKFDI
jgi:hypothetical protein